MKGFIKLLRKELKKLPVGEPLTARSLSKILKSIKRKTKNNQKRSLHSPME